MVEAEEYNQLDGNGCEENRYMDRIQSNDYDLEGKRYEAAMDLLAVHPGVDAITTIQQYPVA